MTRPTVLTNGSRFAPRLWHLLIVVAAVALAASLVREGRMRDPRLIALAVAGFLGWCGALAVGVARLDRAFLQFDDLADASRRRRLKVATGLLAFSAAMGLLIAGLAILLSIQLQFFPASL